MGNCHDQDSLAILLKGFEGFESDRCTLYINHGV